MTCQCTCGKHVLIDTSKSVTMFNNAAAAVAPLLHVVTLEGKDGAAEPWFIPNTANTAPTMPQLLIRP